MADKMCIEADRIAILYIVYEDGQIRATVTAAATGNGWPNIILIGQRASTRPYVPSVRIRNVFPCALRPSDTVLTVKSNNHPFGGPGGASGKVTLLDREKQS